MTPHAAPLYRAIQYLPGRQTREPLEQPLQLLL